MTGVENVGVFIREKVWLKNSLNQSEGGWGWVRVEKQAMEGNDPHGGHGYMCEGVGARVGVRRVSRGIVEVKLLCFRWLSPLFKCAQKGFPGCA